MHERDNNLITRINYDSRAKGAFGIIIFGTLASVFFMIDRGTFGQSLPPFMRGRLFDVMANPFCASADQIINNRDNFRENLASGIIAPSLFETLQGLGQRLGVKIKIGTETYDPTFDPGDYIAYLIGGLFWVAFEGTAKGIHDSGLSLPLYRLLRIRHRKFG